MHKLPAPCLDCIFLCISFNEGYGSASCCEEWDSQPKSHLALRPLHKFSRTLLTPTQLGHFSLDTFPSSHVCIILNANSVAM